MNTRCLVLLLLGSLGSWSSARAQDVVLVANKSVKISEITNADLRPFSWERIPDSLTAPMLCR